MTIDEAFRILEVPAGSSLADVERSYRKLCRVWHPDRFGVDSDLHADAEAKLKQLNVAWDTIRKHYASNPAPERSGSDSPADDSRVFREYVRYLGGDPRLHPVSTIERMTGGRSAIIESSNKGIVLITLDNKQQPFEFAAYLSPDLRLIDRDVEDIWIKSVDPERIVTGIFSKLRFKNEYAAKLYFKRANELFGFENGKAKAAKKPRTTSTKSSDAPSGNSKGTHQAETNESAKALFGFGLIMFPIVVVILLALAAEQSNQTYTPSPPPKLKNPFADNPGAIESGSFTVWTVPEDPAPNEDMRVWIAIRVPTGTTTLSISDVKGRVTATDGFGLDVPLGRFRDKFGTEIFRDGQWSTPSASSRMSVSQGYAQLRVHIPGATRLVRNELQIGSSTLGENHTFSLREY